MKINLKNIILFAFAGITIIVLLFIFKGGYLKPSSVQVTPTPEVSSEPNVMTGINPQQLQEYYDTYKKPYVVIIRTALNAYLANDSSKACIKQIAATSRTDQGIITGLDSFSRDYYKSKFVVLTINDNKDLEGSKDIQIMFQEKPDRIFYAWTGLDPQNPQSGKYCLFGFNSKADIDQATLQKWIEFYKPLIFDKEHSL
jgi:hypothetical protein